MPRCFCSVAFVGVGRQVPSGAEARRLSVASSRRPERLLHPLSCATGGRLWLCRFPGRGGLRLCRLRRLAGTTERSAGLCLRGPGPGLVRDRLELELLGRWVGRLFFRRWERIRRKSRGSWRLGLPLVGCDRRLLSAGFVVSFRGRGRPRHTICSMLLLHLAGRCRWIGGERRWLLWLKLRRCGS